MDEGDVGRDDHHALRRSRSIGHNNRSGAGSGLSQRYGPMRTVSVDSYTLQPYSEPVRKSSIHSEPSVINEKNYNDEIAMRSSEMYSDLATSEPSTALAEWQFLSGSRPVVSRSDLSKDTDTPKSHGSTKSEVFQQERGSNLKAGVVEDEQSKATSAIKPGSIAALVQECIQNFSALEQSIDVGPDMKRRIQDGLGRFRVWAGNVSAHTSGRRSLEYRLRDSSDLSAAVLKFLLELQRVLTCLQHPDSLATDVAPSQDSDSDDEGSFDIFEDDEIDTQSPVAQYLEDMDEVITCLLRISMTLRNPSRSDQIRYAESAESRHFERVDIDHVRAKFPLATDKLVTRLGKAITRHRQYYKYREAHHEKMVAGLYGHDQDERPSTIATSLRESGKVLYQAYESENESIYTATSYAETTSGDSALKPPPRPLEASDGQPFECQLCYHIITAPEERSWRQHLYEDIPPYVCVHEECDEFKYQFSRRREWRQHMKDHNKTWLCPYGCSPVYHSVKHFARHLRTKHDDFANDSTVTALIQSCARPSQVVDTKLTCPLCHADKPNSTVWFKHVGHHLQQLALYPIPQRLYDMDGAEVSSESNSEAEARDDGDSISNEEHFDNESPGESSMNIQRDPEDTFSAEDNFSDQDAADEDSKETFRLEEQDKDAPIDTSRSGYPALHSDLVYDGNVESGEERRALMSATAHAQAQIERDAAVGRERQSEIERLKELIRKHEEEKVAREKAWAAEREAEAAAEAAEKVKAEEEKKRKAEIDEAKRKASKAEEVEVRGKLVDDYEREQSESEILRPEEEQAFRQRFEYEAREKKEKEKNLYEDFKRKEREEEEEERQSWEAFEKKRKEKEENDKLKKDAEEDIFQQEMRARLEKLGYTEQTADAMVSQQRSKDSRSNVRSHEAEHLEDFEPGKKPVYAKIHTKYLALETLKHYDLPWEYDRADSDYIIILRDMKKEETDMLFEYTARLRGGKLLLEPEEMEKRPKSAFWPGKLLLERPERKKPDLALYRRRSRGRHDVKEDGILRPEKR